MILDGSSSSRSSRKVAKELITVAAEPLHHQRVKAKWKIHLASLKHVAAAAAAAVEGLMQSREMQVKSGLGLPKFAKSCH